MENRGLSLVEVLLAMGLLAMIIPLCLQVEGMTLRYCSSVRLRDGATLLAEELLERCPRVGEAVAGQCGIYDWETELVADRYVVRVTWPYLGREQSLEVVTLVDLGTR